MREFDWLTACEGGEANVQVGWVLLLLQLAVVCLQV
jgi:hypothetical protein